MFGFYCVSTICYGSSQGHKNDSGAGGTNKKKREPRAIDNQSELKNFRVHSMLIPRQIFFSLFFYYAMTNPT